MKSWMRLTLMALVLPMLFACGGGGSTTTVTTQDATTVTEPTSGGSTTTGGSSDSSTVTGSTTLTYSTPANFETLLTKAYTPSTSLVASSTVANRSRYMISDAATASNSSKYLSIGTIYSDSTTAGYTAIPGVVTSSSTYDNYLTKIVQLVATSDGFYRLDSHLHPNNSIDVEASTSSLKFRNNFGKTAATANGYVTFSYDTSTHLLEAKNRYIYTYASSTASTPYEATYAIDNSFNPGTSKYVKLTSNTYTLSSTGTPLYFYVSPIDFGIPGFMNPQSVAMVTNASAPFQSKITYSSTEAVGRIYNNVKSTYRAQVASIGSDTSTKSAADSQLTSIKAALEANGEKLRYAPALYSAFRDAALATKLVSDAISDGVPGQNLVPYVYFTNEQDSAGKYHPFMVVVNYGNPASPNGLKDIPRPPGAGTGSYASSKVTRYTNLENYVSMIPMKDYGQVSVVTENTYTRTLWSDVTNTTKPQDVYTYADTADNGILIDGSVMFPNFNNRLLPSALDGELSANGCHVGQGGGGPHCHADGYQSGAALGLYNDSDYASATHPPLIGFGYDGLALFGIYRSSDASMKGYTTALDAFGGHNHDDMGYHYHAHTVTDYQPYGESTSLKSTLHVLMKGAYIGKTNLIPCFRGGGNFTNNKYLGGNATTTLNGCSQ